MFRQVNSIIASIALGQMPGSMWRGCAPILPEMKMA